MIRCTCGRPLTAQHLHSAHMSDGVAVLELYTCRPGCGNTRARELPGPVAGCACPGCDEARASRCEAAAIRRADARGVGEGFAAVRAVHARRMGERRSA